MQRYDVTLTVEGVSQTEQYEAQNAQTALMLAGVGLALSLVDHGPGGDLLAAFGVSLNELKDKIHEKLSNGAVEWDRAFGE